MNQSTLLTSNWTLFLKIVVPTVWTVFFGAFTLVFMFTDGLRLGGLSHQMSIMAVMAFFLIGFTMIYFSMMGLKRIEASEDSLIISNYFKTYRIPFTNVEAVRVGDFTFVKLMKIQFKQPISFGLSSYGLINSGRFESFVIQNASMNDLVEDY